MNEDKPAHLSLATRATEEGERKCTLGIDIGGSSIKLALRSAGRTVWTRRSRSYDRPDRAEVAEALREAMGHDSAGIENIGLCVPGLLDRANRCVTLSVNLPSLVGVSLDALLADALSYEVPKVALLSDAEAAALDLYSTRQLSGRLLLLVLGTGVGAAVWDASGPLHVDGESPGHFGQMDVSVADVPVIGPDAGAGSLEGYLGSAALRQRYGDRFMEVMPTLHVDEPPLLALARAIRIGHAIYRPDHVCLAGGIGNALGPRATALQASINLNLTRVARVGWTLTTGEHDFHAAIGAAKAAEAG